MKYILKLINKQIKEEQARVEFGTIEEERVLAEQQATEYILNSMNFFMNNFLFVIFYKNELFTSK